MPIWMETIVLMLAAYGTGVAIGWAVWGRSLDGETDSAMENSEEEDS